VNEADPDSEPRPVASREVLALVHHHPGRLRVRADAFREGREGSERREDQGDVVDRVRAALDAEPGISTVSHNVRTGSLLVEYEPGLADPEIILSRIAEAAGLERPSDELPAAGKKPALIAIDAAREANAIVADLTGEQTDLRSLVPMGMAALAVFSFAISSHEERIPRWDNLLYWSYNIFSQLHRREIEAGERRTGSPLEAPDAPERARAEGSSTEP
jgi:hypothetical protein